MTNPVMDYYDDEFRYKGVTTPELLNALFEEFGYNQRGHDKLSREFSQVEADRVLQDHGLLEEDHYGVFWLWWAHTDQSFIEKNDEFGEDARFWFEFND